MNKEPTKLEKLINPFLSKQRERFYNSGIYCLFCGLEKKGYKDPKFGPSILDCSCERDFEMLRHFINNNVFWLSGNNQVPHDIINYAGKIERQESHREFVIQGKAVYESMLNIKLENESKMNIP